MLIEWSVDDDVSALVLPLALAAGDFGGSCRGNSSLVESSWDFVDVIQREEREDQTEDEREREKGKRKRGEEKQNTNS